MLGEIQPSLFTPSLSELIKIGLNRNVFGITRNGLSCKEIKCGALKIICSGMHNFKKIPKKMLLIQEGEEILEDFFFVGHFKLWHEHPYNLPQDFFELKRDIKQYSDKHGFACFRNKFKRCFGIEQATRLGLLSQDDQKDFIESISVEYKPFPYDYGEYKETYIYVIRGGLKSLSEEAKQIQ